MSKGDIEFYHSILVLGLAESYTRKPWGTLSWRSRQRHLNRAVDCLYALHSRGVQLDGLTLEGIEKMGT